MTADLHDLLEDAVSDVEPRHALPEIRRRTRRARRVRVGALGVVAAGLAAAVVAVGAAVVTHDGTRPTTPDTAAEPGTHVAALYFVGDTPQGPRLFREFQRVADSDNFESELAALASPDDPDYRSLVNPTTLVGVEIDGDELSVPASREFPMIGAQQLVFTLSAAAQTPFTATLLTPRGSLEFGADPEVLAPIEVSDPAEGSRVDDVLMARGRTSEQARVPWRINDETGRTVLDGDAAVTDTDDLLESWETEIDVSGLAPGTYTFVASATSRSEDVEEGTDPPGATSDTRTIVVE